MHLGENKEAERLRRHVMLVELPPCRRNLGTRNEISLHVKNWLSVAFVFKQTFGYIYFLDYNFYNLFHCLVKYWMLLWRCLRPSPQKIKADFLSPVNALISTPRNPHIANIVCLYYWIFTAFQSYELMLLFWDYVFIFFLENDLPFDV